MDEFTITDRIYDYDYNNYYKEYETEEEREERWSYLEDEAMDEY